MSKEFISEGKSGMIPGKLHLRDCEYPGEHEGPCIPDAPVTAQKRLEALRGLMVWAETPGALYAVPGWPERESDGMGLLGTNEIKAVIGDG